MDTEQAVVILVHGATLNGQSWAPVRRELDSRLRVLTPDLPGHGARRGERYTLEGGVETVSAAVRSIGDAPFIVAGDSLGSYTALAAAAALPQQQLRGLVLGGCSHEFIGSPVRPYMAQALLFRVMLSLFGERRLIDARMPGTLRKFGMAEEDIVATLAAGMSLKAFPQAVASLRGFDFRAKLAQVGQPIMFINGDLDTSHVRGEAGFVAAARNATVHRFADCEHGVSIRRSSGYAALVNRFAQEVLFELAHRQAGASA